MNRTVWVARHGSRLDFVDADWSASAARPHDPPLSETGRVQARELGHRLKDESIAHVFSSPFLRCVETACIAAEVLDLPVRVELGISEWLNRAWFPDMPEISSLEELHRVFPRIDRGYRSRGAARFGESGEEALLRSGETARRLAEELAGNLFFVGHGASVRGIAEGLLGVAPSSTVEQIPEMPYCCLIQLTSRGERFELSLPCDTSHLSRAEGGRRFH